MDPIESTSWKIVSSTVSDVESKLHEIDENDDCHPRAAKRICLDPEEGVHSPEAAAAAYIQQRDSTSETSDGGVPETWQAILGSSIGANLARLTDEKRLPARQVRKLLRSVLTNEGVVAFFRRVFGGDLKDLKLPPTSTTSPSRSHNHSNKTDKKSQQTMVVPDVPQPKASSSNLDAFVGIESRVLTR